MKWNDKGTTENQTSFVCRIYPVEFYVSKAKTCLHICTLHTNYDSGPKRQIMIRHMGEFIVIHTETKVKALAFLNIHDNDLNA